MEEADGIAVGGQAQPDEGNLDDSMGARLGGGRNAGSGDVGGAPFEEEEGRGARRAVANTAPEADEGLPAVEGAVEAGVGDAGGAAAGGPGANKCFGAPAAVAHGEPDGAIGGRDAAEGGEPAGGAGEGGDLGG